jgi:hypothetical protein
MDLIATFPSSQAALGAEQALKGEATPVELIPVPRQIRSDCGFCLLVQGAEGACERLRACGAQELWRVTATQAGPSSRKVYSYERYP